MSAQEIAMQKNWFKLAVVAAVLAFTGAAQAAVIHNDGFTDGTATNNGVVDYRSAGSFSVDLTVDHAQSSAITFDFFGSRSVDGDNGWQDNYFFALNGTTLFEGTFDLGGGGNNVVFTNSGLAYTPLSFGSWGGGTVSVSGNVSLLAGLNTFTFGFTSPGPNNGGGQNLGDEGWGVNAFNVETETTAAVPLPAAMPLLAGAMAGFGALRLRRRKARA
jgi:hypothetical protein